MAPWILLLSCLFVAVLGSSIVPEASVSATDFLKRAIVSDDSLQKFMDCMHAELLAAKEMANILELSVDVFGVPNGTEECSISSTLFSKATEFASKGSFYSYPLKMDSHILHRVVILEYFAMLFVYHQKHFPHIDRTFIASYAQVIANNFNASVAQNGLTKTMLCYKRALLVLIYSGDEDLFAGILVEINRYLDLSDKYVLLDAFISQAAFKNFPDLISFECRLLYLSTVFNEPRLWMADILATNPVIKSEEAKNIIYRVCQVKTLLPQI